MNAVEIEEAVSKLAEQPFDSESFPFAFLEAFGNKETTIKRLETLLHRFFAAARLDVDLKDRFGFQVEPKEWFLLPLPAIEEAIQKLKEGTIESFRYDPQSARLLKV